MRTRLGGLSAYLPFFGVILLTAWLLVPYLSTGYYFDDILNSCTRGHAQLNGITIHEAVWRDLMHWLTRAGRFTPFGQGFHYLWYGLPGLDFYRWVHCGLTLGCVLAFWAFLKRLEVPRARAALICAIVPVLFQLRNYHDPIASYLGLFQISFLMGIGTLLLLLEGLRRKRAPWIVMSVALYAIYFLTYETALIFLPILLLVGWRAEPTRLARGSRFGYIGVTISCMVTAAVLKRLFGAEYAGTQFGLSPWAIWAFICQTSAAIPVIYQLAGKSGLFRAEDLRGFLNLPSIGLVILAEMVFYFWLGRAAREDRLSATARWSALCLVLLPSAMMAASARYQQEINRPGLGYLPVFFAYFGMAILISEVAIGWLRREGRFELKRRVLAAGFALVAVFIFNCNRAAIGALNAERMGNRLLIQSAMESGLLKDLPEGAVVRHSEVAYWLIPECSMQYAGKKVSWKPVEASALAVPEAGTYTLRTGRDADGAEWVSIAGEGIAGERVYRK